MTRHQHVQQYNPPRSWGKQAWDAVGTVGRGIYNNRKGVEKLLKKFDKTRKELKRSRRTPTAHNRPTKHLKGTGKVENAQAHSGWNEQYFNFYQKPKLGKLKRLGQWKYHTATSGFMTAVSGACGVAPFYYAGTPLQLCATTTLAAPSIIQNNIGLMDLNPYMSNTGSRVLTTTVTPLEDRFVWQGVTMQLEMTNLSAVGALIDLYVCRAKRDQHSDPFAQWQAGYNNEAFGQPAEVQPAAGSTTTGLVAGIDNFQAVGNHPMESSIFRACWKILAQKRISIAAAATETVHFNLHINKIVKKDLMTQFIADSTPYARGYTHVVFYVIRGQVVADQSVSVLAETPTYGATKVAYVMDVKYRAHAVAGNSARLGTNRAFLPIPTNAATAAQHLLNEVDQDMSVAAATVG